MGFTVLELLVVFALSGLLMAMAAPNLVSLQGQMNVSEDARVMGAILSQLRAQAIRLRADVNVEFTTNGYRWDIRNDGSFEGNREFKETTSWIGATPAAIRFNALGLVRGIATTRNLPLTNHDIERTLTINKNGFVDL